MRAFVIACMALVLGAASPPAPRPIEAFAKLPFIEDPQLSPDGSRLAAKVAVNGVQRLLIRSIAGTAPPVVVGLGENDLNWWRWVNDEWLVLGIGGTTDVEGEDWYIRRAIGLRADGGKMQKLADREAAQGADDVLWIADDGTPRILLAFQQSIYPSDLSFWPQVHEVDVSTGRMKKAAGPYEKVMSWYADAAGKVRIGVGFDDDTRTSRLLYRGPEGGAFRTVERARMKLGEELTVPALFLEEPGKALTLDSKNGHQALYELDLATMAVGKQVFAVPGHDVDGLISDAKGSGLAGVRYTDDRSRVRWFDPALENVQAQIDKAIGDRRASIASLSRDRSKMIVHVGGPRQPGGYYYYDTAVGTMKLIAMSNSLLKNARLAPVRTIRYAARDGLSIPAVLTLPDGREAKDLPLIVMPHGGPAARDAEEWDWWAQFLADRGYAVVQPNYRGSTGYGTAFADKGKGEWGLKMQDDLNDAVAHLAGAGIADPKRVCMVGGSYGGYAALRAAQRDGAAYRCAVSFAGVTDLNHLARFDGRSLYGNSSRAYLKEKAPDFRSVSPINFPQQFTAPVLLVHGKKDMRVPYAQSREMAEKLRKAGKTVEYVELPEADHHLSREADRFEFLKRLEAFLAKHNPA